MCPVSSTAWVDETVGLAAVFDPRFNVVVLRRRAHEALAAYTSRLVRDTPFTFKATAALGQREGLDAIDELARRLPPDDARDVLVEDLAYWAEVMSELTGSPRVGLRLARLDAPMCPRFHVDHVTVRLVCAYAGPASEWLDERHVDRGIAVGRSPVAIEQMIRRDARPLTCAPLDVVLFKGTAWPDNGARGAIHRSPTPGATPRLLLTIDPLG